MSETKDTTSECAVKQGKIGWNELITSDPQGAIRFYTELFGWTTEKFPMPQGDYTMLKFDGETFGGVMATPQPGVPTHWLNYASVTDIDDALAKATSLGGKTCMGPMEIPGVGRIAVITDPQGAAIGFHQPPAH